MADLEQLIATDRLTLTPLVLEDAPATRHDPAGDRGRTGLGGERALG